MITGLLIYIAGVILAYILGAIWNDYFMKWFKLDEDRWQIYPTSLTILSLITVFVWLLMFITMLFTKIKINLNHPPTFKIKD